MPIYQYKARDEEGRLISGRIDVAGEEELQKRLEGSGFYLVKFSLESKNLFNQDLAKQLLPVTLRDLHALTLEHDRATLRGGHVRELGDGNRSDAQLDGTQPASRGG